MIWPRIYTNEELTKRANDLTTLPPEFIFGRFTHWFYFTNHTNFFLGFAILFVL
ncbi:hypothetical protein [Mycoplasma leonicaptivi]|uniref:hypothetical protein n=1 Tax=Mycoplasma leonicaptivi TaxID=36742 RepID=UPI000B0A9777|nr:hypothetical protein [Mycoplasma leonicaptivi]